METTTSPRAHLERGFRLEQAGTPERALDIYRNALGLAIDPLDKAEARLRIARVLRDLARWDEATLESRAAARLAAATGAPDLSAEAMNVELGVLQFRGSYDEANALGQTALAMAREPRVRGITLQNLGLIAARQRDFVAADRLFAESVEALRAAQYDVGLAIALNNQAAAAKDMGDAERAVSLAMEAAAMCRRLNLLNVLLNAIQTQAFALVSLGDFAQAEELLTEALGYFASAQNRIGQAECLEVLGQLNEARGGSRETARRCYERAHDIAQRAEARALIERLDEKLSSLAS